MADNKNEQRPVRKLTVKNFSVIKEAELEFGKITVVIGPQASGKSLLCKLAYFLSKEIVNIVAQSVFDGDSTEEMKGKVIADFLDSFPRNTWYKGPFVISFASGNYSVELVSIQDAAETFTGKKP